MTLMRLYILIGRNHPGGKMGNPHESIATKVPYSENCFEYIEVHCLLQQSIQWIVQLYNRLS